MVTYIISPKTGKKITVNGDTYNALLKTNYASAVKKAEKFDGHLFWLIITKKAKRVYDWVLVVKPYVTNRKNANHKNRI